MSDDPEDDDHKVVDDPVAHAKPRLASEPSIDVPIDIEEPSHDDSKPIEVTNQDVQEISKVTPLPAPAPQFKGPPIPPPRPSAIPPPPPRAMPPRIPPLVKPPLPIARIGVVGIPPIQAKQPPPPSEPAPAIPRAKTEDRQPPRPGMGTGERPPIEPSGRLASDSSPKMT